MSRVFPLILLALALVSHGCASSGATKPDPQANVTSAPEPVQPEPAKPAQAPEPVQPEPPKPAQAPEPPAPEPEEETGGAYGPKTVVIDEPEPEEETRKTLSEAAKLARETRAAEGGAPVAVITDETLPEYATGELTVAEGREKKKPSASPPSTAGDEAEAEEQRGEEYWRTRVRDARMRWRDLVAEVADLETTSAELRQRFYAEDDGFYRDSQIKPAWDRALDRLAETELEVDIARDVLQAILLEGRSAGALPGWLREGIEYEPEPEEPDSGPGIHEATEPKVIDVDDEGDRP